MRPSPRRLSAAAAGIALGWGLLVVLGVRMGEWAVDLWLRQNEALIQSKEQLRRIQGWIDAEGEVRARQQDALGQFAEVSGSELSWMNLQGFQQAALQQGLSIMELKPAEVAGRSGHPASYRLDAKVAGRLEQFSALLQRLPNAMPGVQLDALQLMPRSEGRIQAVLRLQLFSPDAASVTATGERRR